MSNKRVACTRKTHNKPDYIVIIVIILFAFIKDYSFWSIYVNNELFIIQYH